MSRPVFALALAGALFAGCGGSSKTSPVDARLQALQGCAEANVAKLFATLDALGDLAAAAADPALALQLGVIVAPSTDPADPANTYTFEVNVEGGGVLAGKATFSAPVDDLAAGDTASVAWNLLGDVTGSGDLLLALGAGLGIEVSGDGTLATPGCVLEFDIDAAVPLRITLVQVVAQGLVSEPLRAGAVDILGTVRIRVLAGEDELEADVEADASQDIRFTNVTYNRAPMAGWTWNPEPPVETELPEAWVGRWLLQYSCTSTDGNDFGGSAVYTIRLEGDNALGIVEDGTSFEIRATLSPDKKTATYFFDGGTYTEEATFVFDLDAHMARKTSDWANRPPLEGSGGCTGTLTRLQD